ncbi:MAG TPA: indole-3-glycerol phosphate synthase TrpC [Chitinophagaceae bacterium]|jgi:indole-3-glycerol phosphate synthase|nr:indole-3-glycerol phosphate synthase TrpC [Chitinophagaceae bacterium]
MNILDTIIARKKGEVAERKALVTVRELEKKPLFSMPTVSLKASLADPQRTGIIAEYKRRSPSKGVINAVSPVESVVTGYDKGGASGISVLTDCDFFGGSLSDLEKAAVVTRVPLLRKDFMIDEYQLLEARAYGASVILLIAANLTVAEVRQLAGTAKALSLEVLLEIHNEAELEHICPEVDLVGVNNRDLKTFSVSLETSARLARQIPEDKWRISESGINKPEDIEYLRSHGYQGFLIGENFMRQNDPGAAFGEFAVRLKSVGI